MEIPNLVLIFFEIFGALLDTQEKVEPEESKDEAEN